MQSFLSTNSKMEIELFWETSPVLNTAELKELSNILENIAQITGNLDFLVKQNLPEPLHLNIIIIGDPEIKLINSDYRGKNQATDVLTFPFEKNQYDTQVDDDKTSQNITGNSGHAVQNLLHNTNHPNYAEIYISQDTAIRQSKEQNLTLLSEFTILIVHGLLHAFHYDHETSEESMAEMREHEKYVLTNLGINSIAPLTE